jgi:hypothetical protein
VRNDSDSGNWLTVICETPPGEGPLIGTEITLILGEETMTRDLTSGGSYLSIHGLTSASGTPAPWIESRCAGLTAHARFEKMSP